MRRLKDEIEVLKAGLAAFREELKARITALPDNPRVRRLSPNAFVMMSRDLGNNWSADHHSFPHQYGFICREIDARGLDGIITLMAEIVGKGVVYDANRRRRTFHPDVRGHIAELAGIEQSHPSS